MHRSSWLNVFAFTIWALVPGGESKALVSSVILSNATYRIFTGDLSSIRPLAPTIFLLNGFNVASSYYSNVVRQLAATGFIVATDIEARKLPFPVPCSVWQEGSQRRV